MRREATGTNYARVPLAFFAFNIEWKQSSTAEHTDGHNDHTGTTLESQFVYSSNSFLF